MPTTADTFVILLVVVVVFWAARMGTLGDLVGRLFCRRQSVAPPPQTADDDLPE